MARKAYCLQAREEIPRARIALQPLCFMMCYPSRLDEATGLASLTERIEGEEVPAYSTPPLARVEGITFLVTRIFGDLHVIVEVRIRDTIRHVVTVDRSWADPMTRGD